MAREPLSRGDLLLLVAILAAAGIGDAAYLAYEWYLPAGSQVCDINPFINCTTVRLSVYSSFLGVPTALYGLAGFAVLLALAILAFRGVERLGPWSVDRWLLVFASVGAALGLGLTALEVFVIHALCLFCAIGFAVDLAMLYVVAVPLRRT